MENIFYLFGFVFVIFKLLKLFTIRYTIDRLNNRDYSYDQIRSHNVDKWEKITRNSFIISVLGHCYMIWLVLGISSQYNWVLFIIVIMLNYGFLLPLTKKNKDYISIGSYYIIQLLFLIFVISNYFYYKINVLRLFVN